MRCGGTLWKKVGNRLVLERERGPVQTLGGVGFLLAAGAIGFILMNWRVDPKGLVALGVALTLGIHLLLSYWRVVLDGEAGQVTYAWGLGIPFRRRTVALTRFERVELLTPGSRPRGASPLARNLLQLGGEEPLPLAGSNDAEEVRALAEAVVQLSGLPLQVDGGRVQTRPQPGSEAGSVDVPRTPPPGSRIRFSTQNGRAALELPASGWTFGYAVNLVPGVLVLALVLGFCGYLGYQVWRWGWSELQLLFLFTVPMFLLLALAGLYARGALEAMFSEYRITLSPRGLEVEKIWRGKRRDLFLPRQSIQSIDVREHAVRLLMEARSTRLPMLLIDLQRSEPVALGGGLSKEELEWAAARLRQMLAQGALEAPPRSADMFLREVKPATGERRSP